MSCRKCADLCVEYRIRLPSELRRAIEIARENIADGTIAEVAIADVSSRPTEPFSSVSTDGPWSDVLNYKFRCTSCDEVFELSAETYHGSGGAWRPETKSSIQHRL